MIKLYPLHPSGNCFFEPYGHEPYVAVARAWLSPMSPKAWLGALGWDVRRRLEALGPAAREFKTWAAANALHLDASAREVDPERLTSLGPLVEGKRIVYLAESDHFLHETYVFRQWLTTYLFSRDWRWMGEELGAPDGGRIDHYLATGDERWLERVATFGYRGAWRTDRDDSATGLLRDVWGPSYPQKAMKAEQTRLLRGLRRLSEARPSGTSRLRFLGFDIDAVVGGGYEDLHALLSPHARRAPLPELLQKLERVSNESAREELTRLERALQFAREHADSLQGLLGTETWEGVLDSLAVLRDSLRFVEVAHPATDWRLVSRAITEREDAMVERVRRHLSRLGPGEKLILQGHASHLCKDWPSVRQLGVWAGPPRLNLGTRLHQEFPGQVFCIWMVHGHGQGAQPFTTLPSRLPLRPGTLNALLAQVGSCFLLPTGHTPGARWLSQEHDLSWMYGAMIRTAISRQTDALFFVREVSPLRPESA